MPFYQKVLEVINKRIEEIKDKIEDFHSILNINYKLNELKQLNTLRKDLNRFSSEANEAVFITRVYDDIIKDLSASKKTMIDCLTKSIVIQDYNFTAYNERLSRLEAFRKYCGEWHKNALTNGVEDTSKQEITEPQTINF